VAETIAVFFSSKNINLLYETLTEENPSLLDNSGSAAIFAPVANLGAATPIGLHSKELI
jgi:hypothetical protein